MEVRARYAESNCFLEQEEARGTQAGGKGMGPEGAHEGRGGESDHTVQTRYPGILREEVSPTGEDCEGRCERAASS